MLQDPKDNKDPKDGKQGGAAEIAKIVILCAAGICAIAGIVQVYAMHPDLTGKRLVIICAFVLAGGLLIHGTYCWASSIQARRLANAENRIEALMVGVVIMAVAMIGALVEMLAVATFSKDGFHAACVGLLASLAALMAGIGVGFLFGFPKVMEPGTAPAGNASASAPSGGNGTAAASKGPQLGANTNLTQISDWLTKIIVGVGLVECKKALIHFNDVALAVGQGMTLADAGVQKVVGGSILVYFTVAGFLGGYNLTRLFLTGAFMRADIALDPSCTASSDALKQMEVGDWGELKKGAAGSSFSAETAVAAKQIVDAAAVEAPVSVEQKRNLAKAQFAMGKLQEAKTAYEEVMRLAPRDANIRFEYAAVCYSMDSEHPEKQFEQLRSLYNDLQSTDSAELRKNVAKSLTFSALYMSPPTGFELAIKYGEEYRTNPRYLPSGGIYINLASAYGQQAAYLLKQAGVALDEDTLANLWTRPPADPQLAAKLNEMSEQGTSTQLENSRNHALECVREALKIDATWALRLREMLTTAPGGGDDDMAVFAHDRDFRAAAGLTTA